MKLLSIIIPIYNVSKFLNDCFNSLDRQRFSDDVEIILLDDGSTDNSLQLCLEQAQKDKHYKVFHQENKGVAATRNWGLHLAEGKYIAWIDPDDYITNDWWSIIGGYICKDFDLLLFDCKILSNGTLTEKSYDNKTRNISRDEFFYHLSIDDKIQSYLVNKILPRNLYFGDRTFNNDLSFCEDFEAMIRIVENANKILYINKSLYVYRRRQGSLVNGNQLKCLENSLLYIRLAKDRYDYMKKNGIKASKLGYRRGMLNFCYYYQKINIEDSFGYNEYCLYRKKLRKYLGYLLFHPYLNWHKKVHLILVMLGIVKEAYKVKKWVKRKVVSKI